MHDIVIIGGSPAGFSAAIKAAEAGLKTLVVTHGIDGGGSLKEKDANLDAVFAYDKITGISGFEIMTLSGIQNEYKCKALILAMKAPKRELDIKSMEKFRGNGISYCAACDGFFYRDKKLAIIGFNDFMAHEASEIRELSDDVTILTNGMPLDIVERSRDFINGIKVNDLVISDFYGDDYLLGVAYESGEKEEYDGVFIAYGDATALEISLKTGLITEDGKIVIDGKHCTNLPNIFAAGDCATGEMQTYDATDGGEKAAESAVNYILSIK
jgi:thioredoxin reductase (NADPH)